MLKIEITKEEGKVTIDHSEGADIHEMIGLLATTMNHLTLQAQGLDGEKLFKLMTED